MLDPTRVKALVLLVGIEQIARELGVDVEGMREVRSRRGSVWYGQCPCCRAEHEAKFAMYANVEPRDARGCPRDAGWFRCYRGSCNVHGDALELIRVLEGRSYGGAVARLAAIAGVVLEKLQA